MKNKFVHKFMRYASIFYVHSIPKKAGILQSLPSYLLLACSYKGFFFINDVHRFQDMKGWLLPNISQPLLITAAWNQHNIPKLEKFTSKSFMGVLRAMLMVKVEESWCGRNLSCSFGRYRTTKFIIALGGYKVIHVYALMYCRVTHFL